jgi:hypothetical protein
LKHDELHDKTFLTASVGLSVSGFSCWWLGAWQTVWNRPGCRITVLTFLFLVLEMRDSILRVDGVENGVEGFETEGAVWWEIHRHDFNGMAIQFFGFIFIEDGKGSN